MTLLMLGPPRRPAPALGHPVTVERHLLDAVEAGYRISSVPDDTAFDDPALGVSLEPVSSGEVWRRLSALLPGVEAPG